MYPHPGFGADEQSPENFKCLPVTWRVSSQLLDILCEPFPDLSLDISSLSCLEADLYDLFQWLPCFQLGSASGEYRQLGGREESNLRVPLPLGSCPAFSPGLPQWKTTPLISRALILPSCLVAGSTALLPGGLHHLHGFPILSPCLCKKCLY